MRSRDEGKSITGKAAKTINFDKRLLLKLEQLAKNENSNVSFLVNFLLKEILMNDSKYHSTMAKHYNQKMQTHLFMRDQRQTAEELAENSTKIVGY